jgi:hypothetical protein
MLVSDSPSTDPSGDGTDPDLSEYTIEDEPSEVYEPVESEYRPVASEIRALSEDLLVVAEDVAAARHATTPKSSDGERDILFSEDLNHPLLQTEIDPLFDLL